MPVDLGVWLQRFAEGVASAAPTPEEHESLLASAGVAARASERIAAPLSCWMAAGASVDPAAAHAIARRIADEVHTGKDGRR